MTNTQEPASHPLQTVQARRDIMTETKVLILISKFPATDLALDNSGLYTLSCAIDEVFDKSGLHITELLSNARTFLEELEHRYGPGGERIGQVEASYRIHARPV